MKNTIALVLEKNKIVSITQLVALIGIAVVAPFFHQQLITGPVVNATLFIATIFLGTQGGIMVGLIPSVIALSVGTLPAPLAPMVPYIMISNVILVLIFGYFKERNYWIAIVLASFFKFLFLFSTSAIVVGLLTKKELASSVAIMMSYPQLLTALAGGVLASLFLFIRR